MTEKKKPSLIQLPGGVKFYITLLKVLTTDPDGSPRTFELLRDDESTRVDGGESFFTVYAPDVMRGRRD